MNVPTDPASSNSTAWIVKAESDLRAATHNASAPEPSWDVICFLAQQAAEKYLKALLIARHEAAPRTHDLVALLGLCAVKEPQVTILEADCRLLEPYAVQVRYPDDLIFPEKTEALAALAAARRIREVLQVML